MPCEKMYKLGSLFDGSGGFPLTAVLCGIEPTWAAEVEPYPIAVTRCRFPNMEHYGDVSKISGYDIEPVDIISFGSPCQDLSVAGKRAVKEYTRKSMLTWYNKLHNDSSEYKMWGNGIALPTALYVMQGIQDALVRDC